MEQIADWLNKLGLGRAESFSNNGIDLSVLPDLTDHDLKKLGVLLGHRRRLLRAISDLKHSEADKAAAEPTRHDDAERRQLTIVFCAVVASIALSARLDPEDMRGVIRAYQSACARIISSYDGFISRFLGDGMLAYFGYPRALEEDAEQTAVRASI